MKVAGKKFVELQTSRPPFRLSRSVPSLSLSLRVYLRGARPWTLIQSRDVNVADCRRGQNQRQPYIYLPDMVIIRTAISGVAS